MADNSYYSQGTSNDFLRVKGFDSKWTVSEAPKKKDGWEEVLIKGAKGKKQLSGAEKRARAQKVSEVVLSKADAVRVDIDGGKLLSLVEKDTKRREKGPQAPQEPKDHGPRMIKIGESAYTPSQGGDKGNGKAKKGSAPEPKKSKAPKHIQLTAGQLNAKLADTMAKHIDNQDMQLLSLAEHLEDAFKSVPADAIQWHPADAAAPLGSWDGMYLTLLQGPTAAAASDFIGRMPPKEVASFVDFLIGTSLPGGGLAGRGGDKTYPGLRSLVQLILQLNTKGAAWHQDGAVLSRNLLRSEGRVAGASVPALLWMMVQMSVGDPQSALRSWFTTMIPVVEMERAGGGKLAALAVKVLGLLLERAAGARAGLTLDNLVKLMDLVYPASSAAEAKDKKETAGAGKGAGARNTAALDDMATMWDGIVSCSPVGTGGGESALQVVPAMLPLISSEAHSPELRAAATDIILRCFATDPKGLTTFVQMYSASIKGSAEVVASLSQRWSGLKIPQRLLQNSMRALLRACQDSLEADKSRKETPAELAAARTGKLMKRNQKRDDIQALQSAAGSLVSSLNWRWRCTGMVYLVTTAVIVATSASAFAVSQPECWKIVSPIYEKVAASFPEVPKSVTAPAVLAAAQKCSQVLHAYALKHVA